MSGSIYPATTSKNTAHYCNHCSYKIQDHTFALTTMTTIQITIAAIGLWLPCRFGLYISSLNFYANTFWVAGPTLAFSIISSIINANDKPDSNWAWFHIITGTVCSFCTFAGLITLGFAFFDMVTLIGPNSNLKCSTNVGSSGLTQVTLPALMANAGQIIIYIYYAFAIKEIMAPNFKQEATSVDI
ncbi:hypothetical protein TrispH2_009456 [Trichoplax sp. H2]|nr:hypothetical protein TrispH2_009456 [Trichoplax sp. H2]|eukprot:RDD38855.1 hypothetical protein TrispH2_009456 [Trichoplax sp. H2]